MRLWVTDSGGLGHVSSWHVPELAVLRGIRYRWVSAGILFAVLVVLLVPTDTRVEPATASLEPASREGALGRLEFAATGSDFPVLELRRPQSGEAPYCQAGAFCWDPATGHLGSGKNAVFYGPLLPVSSPASVTGLSGFEPGTPLSLVLEDGHSYEYSIVRTVMMATNDPQLRGYAAPTPGEVITLIDCQGPASSDAAISCQGKDGDAFVLRAEALAATVPPESRSIGPAPGASWGSLTITLPGLLIGHLL